MTKEEADRAICRFKITDEEDWQGLVRYMKGEIRDCDTNSYVFPGQRETHREFLTQERKRLLALGRYMGWKR